MAASGKGMRNQGFVDMATLGGTRTASDIDKTSYWTNKKGTTSGVTTRYRSGSITETHMHGSGVGTATHTDRTGTVASMTGGDMNSIMKTFVKGRHGY